MKLASYLLKINLGDSCSSLTDYPDYQRGNEKFINGSYEKIQQFINSEDRKNGTKDTITKGMSRRETIGAINNCLNNIVTEKSRLINENCTNIAQFCQNCGHYNK